MSQSDSTSSSASASPSPFDFVQLDGLVVLKIIKHCQENLPENVVTGQLLGMEVDRVLEVTNCFPYLQKTDDGENAESEDQGQDYQIEMMRNLREVNVDHDSVGWYSSTLMGTFVNDSTIDIQFNFQDRIKESIMVVYDPVKSSFGSLSLKAYRLTDAFMALYRTKTFSKQSVGNLSFEEIFAEIPLKIHNSSILDAFLLDLEEKIQSNMGSNSFASSFERLDFSKENRFLEKNLELLTECLEDLSSEQTRFQAYQKALQKQQTTTSNYKLPLEPSRLETLLINQQMDIYCNQINLFSKNCFAKLFLNRQNYFSSPDSLKK